MIKTRRFRFYLFRKSRGTKKPTKVVWRVHGSEEKISLSHPNGSAAEILLYGATVVSWKSGTKRVREPEERLFVSGKAFLDGSKPVRGGIPVVFPCFGSPIHPEHLKLGQHGFGRSEPWNFAGILQDDISAVSVQFTLEPTQKISAVYPRQFHLTYIVTLQEYQLNVELHVKNTSLSESYPPDSLEFQALLHNYIRAPARDVLITPLQGQTYYDKTEATEEGRTMTKIEKRAGVNVRTFTDFVYENVDASRGFEITWPGGGITIMMEGFKDLVVWNPQADAGSKIGDMENKGWEKYVCVEPGYVRGFVGIEPGKTWKGRQVLSVIHEERRLNVM